MLFAGKIFLRRKEEQFGFENIQISDYSVMISNVDVNLEKEEIIKFLEKMGAEHMGRKVRVVNVILSYKIKSYIDS